MKLYWARDVRMADRVAIEEMAIPSLALMENAARAVTGALLRRVPELLAGRVAILCGRGNNGGDGLAVARLLKGAGYTPEVLLLGDPKRLSPDARAQFERIRACGVPCAVLAERDLPLLQRRLGSADLVLDALLGTGLAGPVSGYYADAIHAINESGAFVAAGTPWPPKAPPSKPTSR
jgi:NAD(P)H-hydrate epimerase